MESISYITCTHNKELLNKCLLPTLRLEQDDELIIVENPESIAIGYNFGIEKTQNKRQCFIHHDLIITNSSLLRMQLIAYCTEDIGMVGVIGSITDTVPWWEGKTIGSALESRMGLIYFSEGKEFCETLDGILLATCQDVEFDETIPGFHLYDQDICTQMNKKGLRNFCMSNGYRIGMHYTFGNTNVELIDGYNLAKEAYSRKWEKQ